MGFLILNVCVHLLDINLKKYYSFAEHKLQKNGSFVEHKFDKKIKKIIYIESTRISSGKILFMAKIFLLNVNEIELIANIIYFLKRFKLSKNISELFNSSTSIYLFFYFEKTELPRNNSEWFDYFNCLQMF